MKALLTIIHRLAQHKPVVFPLHPRTRTALQRADLLTELEAIPAIRLLPPLGYLEFLHLLEQASVVLTDSGGVQEETTVLNVPCVTLRTTTERPITLTHGTNQLLPTMQPDVVEKTVLEAAKKRRSTLPIIPGWDGHTAKRIVRVLVESMTNNELAFSAGHETVSAAP